MRIHFSLLVFIFSFSFTLVAQQGQVKYIETVSFEPNPNMPPEMAAEMSKSKEFYKILTFNENESVYKRNAEDEPVEEAQTQGRGHWRRSRTIHQIQYKNQETAKKITFRDLFGKEFLVADTLDEFSWKIIAGEQRDILGYTCMKAEYKKDTSLLVTAWFTPQIPVSVGPGEYHGLPGLILAASVGENRVILAKEVRLSTTPITVEKPSKGDAISQKDFDKLEKEKREEMKAMYGGDRRRMGN